jgi:hypothetical protein
MKKIFKQIHLRVYTVLIQGISTIFIEKCQPIFVFKKVQFIKIFNSLPHSLTILENEKAKFKLAFRKQIHSPFTLYLNFLYVEMMYDTGFKMFIVFCTVKYLCMSCYTSYCLCDTCGFMECMCVVR